MAGPRRTLIAVFLVVLASAAVAGAAAPPLAVPAPVPPDERARIEGIAREAFVSTQVDGPPHFMRPEVFEYLLDHPEFASQVTRALALARYRIWHDARGLWLDDGWGTKGRFVLVHAAPGRRLYHARGGFEQPYLPEMRGEAVAMLEYAFRPEPDGRVLVESRATGYVQIDSRFLRLLGSIAMPFVQAKADREAAQLMRVFTRVSRAIENNPAQVYLRVSERPEVSARELAEFRELLRLR